MAQLAAVSTAIEIHTETPTEMQPPNRAAGRHRPAHRRARRLAVAPSSAVHALAWSSLGLLTMVVGYCLGWLDRPYALAFFYIGLVGMTIPCGALLLAGGSSRREFQAASVGLGTLLYLGYFLSSPLIAIRFDETLHSATLTSLLVHHRLLQPNPFLPISPYYPGLELATAAVRWCTGLPLTMCQFAVVLTCRIALLVLLFRLVERYTRSPRAAGFAVALYTTSSQFFFFNAQFAYQTIAIVFTLGAIDALQSAMDARAPVLRRSRLATAIILLAALTISHHLISWLTAGLLWAWLGVLLLARRRKGASPVAIAAMVGTVLVGAWVLFLGSRLASYLDPLFGDASSQLAGIVSGQQKSRAMFTDAGGNVTPPWEMVAIDGSVLAWAVLTALAGWSLWRKRMAPSGPLRLLPLGIALCYPLLIAGRVSPMASNIADRASTFVMFANALIVGAYLARRLRGAYQRIALVGFCLLMVGGTILGSGPDWSRVPGPFMAGSEQRSIDASSLATVGWAAAHLPDGSRIGADLTLDRLIPALTTLHPVTTTGGDVNVSPIFFAPSVDESVRAEIRDAGIDFLFVDTRLSQARWRMHPMLFEGEQPPIPLEPAGLAKFAHAPGFRLIYDGPIRIYDTRAISHPTAVPEPALGVDSSAGRQLSRLLVPVWWQLALTLLAVAVAGWLLRRTRVVANRLPLELSLVVAIVLGLIGAGYGYRPLIGNALAVVAIALLVTMLLRRSVSAADEQPVMATRAGRHRKPPMRAVFALVACLFAAAMLAVTTSHHALYSNQPIGAAVQR